MSGLPQRERALIRGGWVLTMDGPSALRSGAVLINEGEIEAVAGFDELSALHPDAPVVGDGSGILLPGFVNAHTHLSEALIPGMGSEMTLFEWGRDIVTPVSENLTAEMADEGTVLKAAEMLHSGVTCVNDMFVHANPRSRASLGVVSGLRRAGLRGVVSFGAEDALDGVTAMEPMAIDEILAEHEDLAAAADSAELVDFRYGIGTLLGQSDELLAAGADLCKRNGWGVHTHLAEVREEVVHASLRWGRRTIDHAAQLGLLDVPLLAGHVIWVTEADIATLTDAGAAVAHNPVANMILGSGVSPVVRLRAAGLPVGIGTDGAASNDSQNMLEAVKTAALLQKVHALDPSVVDASDVLEMATRGGAEALGLSDRIGSLVVGKRADIVLLQSSVELATIHDPAAQVVYGAGPRSVHSVWVDGRRLLDAGSIMPFAEAAQIETGRTLAREIAERAGLAGNHSLL